MHAEPEASRGGASGQQCLGLMSCAAECLWSEAHPQRSALSWIDNDTAVNAVFASGSQLRCFASQCHSVSTHDRDRRPRHVLTAPDTVSQCLAGD